MEAYVLGEAMAVKAMKGYLMVALRLPNLLNDGRKSAPLKYTCIITQIKVAHNTRRYMYVPICDAVSLVNCN